MQEVSEERVLRHWLACEDARTDGGESASGTGADPEAVVADGRDPLVALLERKPGAANFLVGDGVEAWYRTTLGPGELEALALIESPTGVLWDALSPDGTVGGAARRVVDGDPASLAAETGVDVAHILDLEATLGDDPAPTLVVRGRRGRAPWVVADGNHRAVARAVRLARPGGDRSAFAPQPVYFGTQPNPVLRPVRERLGGLVGTLVP
jgi:hypothetical protein